MKVRKSYLPRPDKRSDSRFSLKSTSRRFHLGPLKNIRDKGATCSFCSLVLQTVKDSTILDEAQCYINWEVDGREAASGLVKGCTRRIHVRWEGMSLRGEILEDSYLVFMAPERYLLPNSDAQHVWGNEALFLGRRVGHPGGNQALIKSWLDLCRNSHHSPCNTDNMDLSEKFDLMIQESYFGVIDVVDLQLTALPR